jgi:hypothetical protein
LEGWPETQADCNAFVGALLSLPLLQFLSLQYPSPAGVIRLLGHPALRTLMVFGVLSPLWDSPASAALLCDALRANTQLESLCLCGVGFWQHMDAAASVLGVLQAHPSLTELDLRENVVLREHTAVGAALGALIAHAPVLRSFNIPDCDLGDAGLGPIMDALPHARRLQKLECGKNGMSGAFAAERLLPAVRACASLRELNASDLDDDDDGLQRVEPHALHEAAAVLALRRG